MEEKHPGQVAGRALAEKEQELGYKGVLEYNRTLHWRWKECIWGKTET